MDVLGQAPGELRASVPAKAPTGWQVTTTPRSPLRIRSLRLPVQKTVSVQVTVPPGTAAGSYPVRLMVEADGAGQVTLDATVEVRPAAKCATATDKQCAVDLSRDMAHDGTASTDNPGQGDFDGSGWSYDAGLLPAAGPVTWDGIRYEAPDPTGTAANFVEAGGQTLLLPARSHGTLHLVAASHNGPVTTALTVRYTDGSSSEVPLKVGDWAGQAPDGTTVVLDMPHRIKAGQGVDGPPVRLFGSSVELDSTKEMRSLTLPNDRRIEVYAITLS
ncbi:NEW3 domain-containing protein [Streptomyces sp. NPDC020766]|uniref:COG1470 family protein n=1 Tax=Streptomyces sp. NPDC020766 TaxID=3155011 RepID=UPI0033E667D1